MKGSRRLLVRQWALVNELGNYRYGLTVRQLIERTGKSKQTVYRDLATLRDAGVQITSDIVNGEARHRLRRRAELPALDLTGLQVAALHLARAELEPLAGSGIVTQLDALLAKLKPPESQQRFQLAAKRPGRPNILKVVESALEYGRRARIEYRAASRNGAPTTVHIEPLLVTVAERPYVRAYCVERNAERTYKIDRIAHIELTQEPSTYRGPRAPIETSSGAVKIWTGDPTTVKIRLEPEVAWRAGEYPLVRDQTITTHRDGSAVLEARVEGIVETAHWVLGWGGAAEALEPAALRELVRAELAKALGKYERPGPRKTRGGRESQQKSTRRFAGRLTQAGTRGA
ncbi:MAG TPA: WYL domain-containing protein [Polyangiaceae bacterium]|nr:WYL domain-containing protein [Polyangiaceae bacterium]